MDHAYKDLAVELVQAFVQGGKERPVLPAGRRDEAIALLTRLMVNDQLLSEYASVLNAERRRQGVRRLLMELETQHLPVEAVAEQGLDVLDDDQLADLAIDRLNLALLAEYVWEMMGNDKAGEIWWQTLAREEEFHPYRIDPEAYERILARWNARKDSSGSSGDAT